MFCLFQPFVKDEHHRRKDRNAADNAKYHAFCHYDAKIHAQRKRHKAHGKKPCDRCDGTSHNRRHGLGDRMRHRTFLIPRIPRLIFLVAVPEKYGVIHRNGKLQHRGKRLCDK